MTSGKPSHRPKDAVELMIFTKEQRIGISLRLCILNMDQDFNKQDSMSDVILSRQKWAWCQIHARVETGAVEAHYPKTIKLSILA